MRRNYTATDWNTAWKAGRLSSWGALVGVLPLVWPEASEQSKDNLKLCLLHPKASYARVSALVDMGIPQARMPRALAQDTRIEMDILLKKESREISRVVGNLIEKLVYTVLSSIVAGWSGESE